MAWQIKDEWLDLAQARHVVIYHNPDVTIEIEDANTKRKKQVPVEHHLIHHFAADACPHCGHVKERKPQMMAKPGGGEVEAPGIDFHQVKADTLDALNNHHQKLMQYRAKHPNVPLRSGPKS